MRKPLKEFQETSVARLFKNVQRARRDVADDSEETQAVLLSAPTGSGKTMMVTRLMELILEGDESTPGDRDATFLWITDQPDLNEQSRRKVVDTSSVFTPNRIVTIDAGFDQPMFGAGNLHFLNTQKIGKEKYLVTKGDKRQFTIWDTIARTVDERPSSFYVILDEAHKGMLESKRDRDQATTIVQKFIKGSDGEIPPIPLIVGLSATPDRFVELIGRQKRVSRREDVDPAEVRASGLLKDKVHLLHPVTKGPSEWTSLQAAACKWRDFAEQWSDYSDEEKLMTPVRPVLVVQVENEGKNSVSRTNLGRVVQVLEEALGPLPDKAIAHSFQEGTAVRAGGRQIRRVAPPDIETDEDLQVVLFKLSLNTGWDCPRAEVIMSFRRAIDDTHIAQLVGRMVRTPLADRVTTNEFLNTVCLYLPYYDEISLKKVVKHLTQPSPDEQMPMDVEDGTDVIQLHRRPKTDHLFDAATGLPTYDIERVSKASNSRRIMRFARALEYDELLEGAMEEATKLVVGTISKRLSKVQNTKKFDEVVRRGEEVVLRDVSVELGVEVDAETAAETTPIAAANLEDVFSACGRRLGEGLHMAYAKSRASKVTLTRAKLELHALLDDELVAEIEKKCGDKLKMWQQKYQNVVLSLSDARRNVYQRIRKTAAKAEAGPLVLPSLIQERDAPKSWPRHLFVSDHGDYPCSLNTWETAVIERELRNQKVKGWLRNGVRKPWSLAIPYELHGETKATYPDFLVFRDEGNGILVDVLEPHQPNQDDFWAKASGLAKYAGEHGDRFGRIEIISKLSGKRLRHLDLNDEDIREAVIKVKDNEHLRQILTDHGS